MVDAEYWMPEPGPDRYLYGVKLTHVPWPEPLVIADRIELLGHDATGGGRAYLTGLPVCAPPGSPCYACPATAALCWHHADAPNGRYPLCQDCAARWRDYRAPARLHTLGAPDA